MAGRASRHDYDAGMPFRVLEAGPDHNICYRRGGSRGYDHIILDCRKSRLGLQPSTAFNSGSPRNLGRTAENDVF